MKELLYNKITAALAAILLALSTGCSKELAPAVSDDDPAMVPLRITTRASLDGTSAENAIRTLRLIVFSADGGKQLFNKLYLTSSAANSVTPGEATYFVTDGNGYAISELLPKQKIKLVVVANELAPLNMADNDDYMRGQVINYFEKYATNGLLNIVIDGKAADTNLGYMPMIAKTDYLEPYQWGASDAGAIEMGLVRNPAKVTVRLRGGNKSDLTINPGDKIEIQSAAIYRMPQLSYLGYIGLNYSGGLVSGITQAFKSPITVDDTGAQPATDQLSFYIPEYMIGEQNAKNGLYTYLQINAVYTSNDTNEQINSVYKIPLGDGVQKLYDGSNTTVDNLTSADLTISRNTCYDIDATVTTIGTLSGLQIVMTIEPWKEADPVDGSDKTPRLNIGSLQVKMDEQKARLYFWTNQSQVTIEPQAEKNGTPVNVADIFDGLTGASASNLHLFSQGEDLYYPYRGYVDFEFTDAGLYTGATDTYTVVFNAGGLKRTVAVIANPVVARVIFDGNGGTLADGSGQLACDVHYSDLKGNPLNTATIDYTNPKDDFTPPTGKTFSVWAYSLTEDIYVTGSNTETCSVSLTGTVTTAYARWK